MSRPARLMLLALRQEEARRDELTQSANPDWRKLDQYAFAADIVGGIRISFEELLTQDENPVAGGTDEH